MQNQFTPNFTTSDDVADVERDPYTGEEIETKTDEEAIEMDDETAEQVKELIEELRCQFRTLAAVRPTCETVKNLLHTTGHNSWSEFKIQFKDELAELFVTDSTALPEETIDKSSLIRAERQRDLIKEKIAEVEKSIKAYEHQKKVLETRLAQAELDALATEGMEWDKEAHQKHLAAKKTQQVCRTQLEAMAKKNPGHQLKQLYFNHRHACAIVRYAESCLQGNIRIMFNSGNTKEDAADYVNCAKNSVWELNKLLDREKEIEEKMVNERYSGADLANGGVRFTTAPFEDTGGGVFEANVEKLHRVRDDIERKLVKFTACEAGYELCATYFQPTFEGEWFPEWKELAQLLKEAKQRDVQWKINRAKSQLESARQYAQR